MVKLEKQLQSQKRRRNKIDQVLESIKEENTANGTDTDCKIMKGRQGSHAGYNSQLVVDQQHGLIVSFDAVTEITDHKQLGNQVKKAEQVTSIVCTTVCADAGYSSIDHLKPLLDEGKNVVVPSHKQAQKQASKDPFSKENFKYSAQKDEYTCPEGQQMYRSYQANGSNKIVYRMKDYKVCQACVHYGQCTKAKKGRTINRLANERLYEQLEKDYLTEKYQAIYKKRKMYVEHPFGHIKRNLGAGSFLMRGIEGANAELSLLGSCFNISRLITIMGGVESLISKVKMV